MDRVRVRADVLADLESRRAADLGTSAADRVVVDWIGPGTGPFQVRKRDFVFMVDEPVERGGTGTAPNPLAYFLAGAASCLANHYVSLAIAEGVLLRGLRVAALGHFDRVLIGGAFRDIGYDVSIETDETVDRIRDLVARADGMCFASNTLANAGVILTTRLVVNGAVTATLRRGDTT
ncbi:MAG: OsmC family protein [Sporichthyaceae bacterium]|nr:OsmC family protein [Sporichthyaceae bacterium]